MAQMRLPRFVAAGVVALALATGLAACGKEAGTEESPAREGLAIEVAGVDYNVFITRELNLRIAPDKAYFTGAAAKPGMVYYGVFIQACGVGKRANASDNFVVEDNQGNRYLPRKLPKTNSFAYNPRPLTKNHCIPQSGSVAQLGPTAGAMLLFEFPLSNTENRPLQLIINPPGAAASTPESKRVDLDL